MHGMNVRTGALLVTLALTIGWWLAPDGSPAGTRPRVRPAADALDAVVSGPSQFTARLRASLSRAPGAPATRRNPFEFATARASPAPSTPPPSPYLPPVTLEPPAPAMTLAGIGTSTTPDGVVRTAVISARGEVWLVKAGDELPTGLRVVSVEEAHVILTDAAGTQTTLRLK